MQLATCKGRKEVFPDPHSDVDLPLVPISSPHIYTTVTIPLSPGLLCFPRMISKALQNWRAGVTGWVGWCLGAHSPSISGSERRTMGLLPPIPPTWVPALVPKAPTCYSIQPSSFQERVIAFSTAALSPLCPHHLTSLKMPSLPFQ